MSTVRARVPLRASIFAKLFVVVVGSGLLANLVTFSGILRGSRPRSMDRFHDNMRHYAALMGQEIVRSGGIPAAEKFAREYQLGIRLEGAYTWASDPTLPTFEQLARMPGPPPGGRRPPPPPPFGLFFGGGRPPGHMRPHVVADIVTDRGPVKIALFAPPGPEHEFEYRWLIAILVLLSLLSLGTYWFLRRALLPIGPMLDVVDALGRGDFEKRLDTRGADELSVLGRAIDDMGQKLRATLAAKERLLVDVSHELRSPLTRARLALEFVADGPKKTAINEDIAEMEAMVSTILDEARLRSGEPVLKLAEADLASLIEHLSARYPRVKLSLPSTRAIAQVDATRVTMIVRNLVENAAKYAPENTHIDVSLSQEGNSWRIAVRDRGPGIPAAELARVFEPFYRVDESRTRATGGFGLGLTLARRIAEAHGGTLQLQLPAEGGLLAVCLLPARR